MKLQKIVPRTARTTQGMRMTDVAASSLLVDLLRLTTNVEIVSRSVGIALGGPGTQGNLFGKFHFWSKNQDCS